MEGQGIAVEETTDSIAGRALMQGYYIINAGETASLFADLERRAGKKVTRSEVELTTWVIYQAGLKLSAVDYSQTLSAWDQISYAADKLFEKYDLYLTPPTTATTAPQIKQDLIPADLVPQMENVTALNKNERLQLVSALFERSLALTPFTQRANITGQPAISLPTYLSARGLPLGIQFIARKGNERLLLQISKLFEENGKFKMLLH